MSEAVPDAPRGQDETAPAPGPTDVSRETLQHRRHSDRDHAGARGVVRGPVRATADRPGGVRPIVVLSRCLEQDACRYNAQMVHDDFVREIEPFVRFVTTCPEVEIGLGVPRDPIRLVRIDESSHLVQPSTGRDLTDDMRRFASRFVESVGDVDGFILKNRSPSCGIKDVKVFAAAGSSPAVGTGPGMFAEAVLDRFGGLAIEDEGRLRNPTIRHHFLTRLFALARFRGVRTVASRGIADLVRFHTSHKLLLMAHDQASMRELGGLVAHAKERPLDSVMDEYGERLGRLLARPAKPGPWVNVAQHAFGYFSDELSAREKTFFATLLSDYRSRRLPLQSVLSVLAGWVVRFRVAWLEDQAFFEPYPTELLVLDHP
jgi:uncharacterized protein YbgA (DUF1722 family)/uncharacterized protein YbbK (DUF523 family)